MSHVPKRLPLIAAAAIVAVALLTPGHAVAAKTLPGAVVGSGPAPLYDPNTGSSFRAASAAQADAVVAAYWTPERLASAKPVQLDEAAIKAAAAKAEVALSKPAKPLYGDAPAAPSIQTGDVGINVNFTHAAGKVFFRNPSDGGNYVCSGGTLNTPKQRIVITAGHCVHGGSGQTWMQNWVFYPGYQNGEGAAGRFAAYTFWTTQGWTNNSNFSYDTAFVPTHLNQYGQKVVARVGGNGIIYDPGRPFVTSIGYPTHVGNGGQLQTFCQGTLSRRNVFNSDQQLNCNLRRGASGSVWLKDYDTSFARLGWAVANYSYFFSNEDPSPAFGPYWDTWTKNVRDAAENSSP
ncbi:trypsin-like serine peptidase [Allorhizocola rhizosphaerae]|uniref:trypsin-like serine peptidase n=1 Tax=Allorhizocola rhizosphaerae TaxID=1872709 RepID=UPI000E3C323E|nr:hypothetical protein [Allorhizocola rhizosphaerae]